MKFAEAGVTFLPDFRMTQMSSMAPVTFAQPLLDTSRYPRLRPESRNGSMVVLTPTFRVWQISPRSWLAFPGYKQGSDQFIIRARGHCLQPILAVYPVAHWMMRYVIMFPHFL